MDPSSYVTFVFPQENNYRFLVERDLLTDSKKTFDEEESVSGFSRSSLDLTVKYLKNPEENILLVNIGNIYKVAKFLELSHLTSKIEEVSLNHRISVEKKNVDQESQNNKVVASKGNNWLSVGGIVNTLTFPVRFTWNSTSSIVSTVYNSLVDGNHQWKEHRYAVILDQHRKHLHMPQYQTGGMEGFTRFAFLSLEFFLSSTDKNSRELYKNFIKEFRSLCQLNEYEILFENPQESIEKMAIQHFTEIVCLPFLTKLCLFLASKQNPLFFQQVLHSGMSFSEKFEKLKLAIDNVDTKLTKPTAHVLFNKCEKLVPGFDSLAKSNMPWKCLDVHLQKETFGSCEERKVTFVRSGVPVNDDGIVPEFDSFVSGLKREGKKIAMMVHLDPSYFNTETFIAEEIRNDFDKLKRKESKWIEKIVEMEKKFPETMEVFLLPFDGTWIKLLELRKFNLNELKTFLLNVVKNKQSILLSQSARKQEVLETEKEVEEIFNGVVLNHFYDKKFDEELSSDEKKAFLVLFYHDLTYNYALKFNCDIVLNHCTDGRDRTAIMLFALAAKCNSLSSLSLKETCQIIGTSFGPALALAKKSPHSERWPYMLATAKQLEKYAGSNLYENWKVKNFVFPEDEEQLLLPPPSKTTTLEQYKLQLEEERQYPFLLPNQVTLAPIDGIEKEELFKQASRDLPCMDLWYQEEIWCKDKEFIGNIPSIVKSQINFKESRSFCEEFEEKILSSKIKKEGIRHQILFFLTQSMLSSVFQKLANHYNNEKLNITVVSGWIEEEVRPRAMIKVNDLQLTVTIERKFPIVLTVQEKREVIGRIEVTMEITLDNQENISRPVMKWKVL